MPLVQTVENGKIIEDSSSQKYSKETPSNDLGYDQFLQILCAEMQYQDPLEPTTNTEYIAQLATFSQLESTLDLNDKVTSSMANDLVGKYVILKTTSSTTGETNYIAGVVDYVMYENGETYVSVNDGLYSINDLDTVADAEYMEAITLAKTFQSMIAKLPIAERLTLADEGDLTEAREYFDNLTSYQQSFINKDDLDKLEKLEAQMKKLKGTESSGSTDSSGSDSAGTDSDTVTE